jgi:hypothetical protein
LPTLRDHLEQAKRLEGSTDEAPAATPTPGMGSPGGPPSAP